MSVGDKPKDHVEVTDTLDAEQAAASEGTHEVIDIDAAASEEATVETADEVVSEPASAELKAEVEAMREKVLRSQADMQNLRRRCEKDVEQAHKFGQERLIKELLPVIDNFERAVETAPEGTDAVVIDGIKMTQDALLSALKKFNVEQIDPMGTAFDPTFHQAVSIIENVDVEPNTVIAVMQKGYTLNERLVRPAMVIVSKDAPKVEAS